MSEAVASNLASQILAVILLIVIVVVGIAVVVVLGIIGWAGIEKEKKDINDKL